MQASIQSAQRIPGQAATTLNGEPLFLYLAVSEYVVLGALIRKEEKIQWLVYYINKRLIDIEIRYPKIEKLVLGLVVALRKLRLYFHSYTLCVLTSYPMRQAL